MHGQRHFNSMQQNSRLQSTFGGLPDLPEDVYQKPQNNFELDQPIVKKTQPLHKNNVLESDSFTNVGSTMKNNESNSQHSKQKDELSSEPEIIECNPKEPNTPSPFTKEFTET